MKVQLEPKSSIEEALYNLHETGFRVNEYKIKGINSVPLENFESLLNWAIDAITEMKDVVFKNN